MDALGFALEGFDAIGRRRERYRGGAPIDTAGQWEDGTEFAGPAELRRDLAGARRDQFVRCLTEKLLTYALGRGVKWYDRPRVEAIVTAAAEDDYRFSALIVGLVASDAFGKQSRQK